jgi:hypothetical protein
MARRSSLYLERWDPFGGVSVWVNVDALGDLRNAIADAVRQGAFVSIRETGPTELRKMLTRAYTGVRCRSSALAGHGKSLFPPRMTG